MAWAATAVAGMVLAGCAPASMSGSPAPSARPSPQVSASVQATPTPVACDTQALLASWPVSRLALQTITVPAQQTDVEAVLPEVASGVGGVILFGASTPHDLDAQLHQLVANAPSGIAPLVMTDEEGGAVQRMPDVVGDIPSARDLAATLSAAQIRQLAQTAASRMLQAGVNMDLAPVLDLDDGTGPNDRDPDGSRSFSVDPSVTTADGLAFAQGLQSGGVIPVVKHFPGLGSATGNTDSVPAATLPWSTLQGAGLLPFKAAVAQGLPAVMVANASVPGLTALPASISRTVIQSVLRDELGFTGLVMTDSLSAGALSMAGYDVPHAVVAALEAGADMVLFTASAPDVAGIVSAIVAEVTSAVQSGALPRSSLADEAAHVLAAKGADLCA